MCVAAISKNGVTIRLPDERWQHIVERHDALANCQDIVLAAIADPERILDGNAGALMAVRSLEPGKALVVVYKEVSETDGFVVTAFPTRRFSSLNRRMQLWP